MFHVEGRARRQAPERKSYRPSTAGWLERSIPLIQSTGNSQCLQPLAHLSTILNFRGVWRLRIVAWDCGHVFQGSLVQRGPAWARFEPCNNSWSWWRVNSGAGVCVWNTRNKKVTTVPSRHHWEKSCGLTKYCGNSPKVQDSVIPQDMLRWTYKLHRLNTLISLNCRWLACHGEEIQRKDQEVHQEDEWGISTDAEVGCWSTAWGSSVLFWQHEDLNTEPVFELVPLWIIVYYLFVIGVASRSFVPWPNS